MHRLFVNAPMVKNKVYYFRYSTYHYLKNVLKTRVADTIIIFNGNDGEWLSKICLQDTKRIFN